MRWENGIKFTVTGMTCAACSARMKKVSRQVPGVEAADVNLLAGTMVVTAEEDVSVKVIQAVQSAGYHAFRQGEPVPKKQPRRQATYLK